uniref:ditrans,polycis-polyprenyl diphosphate synthase [(2E,6E)-farnesyldiphosphate specific] n=1 Tax=Seriola lalandi dorsalis TaxID=1841481 RepID=A0A3B4WEH7_SERLL
QHVKLHVGLLSEHSDVIRTWSPCSVCLSVVSCRPTVKVLSPEDGKQSIVQAAQQLCRSVENKERSSKDISVSMLDILLRGTLQCNIPDPELVLKFGPVNSTLGFLPWHIRLTEFIFCLHQQLMSLLSCQCRCVSLRIGQSCLSCVSCSVSSAPCRPTETCPMRTCWAPCSGMAPVSSGSASDVQASFRFFR